MEKVTIEIDESGNPTIKVEGVKGKGCKKLTEDVEKALGSVTSDKITPEYSQTEVQRRVNQ